MQLDRLSVLCTVYKTSLYSSYPLSRYNFNLLLHSIWSTQAKLKNTTPPRTHDDCFRDRRSPFFTLSSGLRALAY